MSEEMTRKEAIEHLKDLDDIVGLDAYGRKAITIDIEDIKAIRMAIASLETDEAYQLEYENPNEWKKADCNNCKNNLHRGNGTSYCATGDGMCHFESERWTGK